MPREERDDDEPDDYDDVPAERPRRRPRKSGDGVSVVIPYKNGAALAAYYCGVFGLIPLIGFILGPIAFILGIIGFAKARKNPQAHGTGHAITGVILGVVDLVIWPVLWIYVFDKMTGGK